MSKEKRKEWMDKLLAKYAHEELGSRLDQWGECQYDDISAMMNYCMVRHLKPKTIVEFGTRTGRCTYDILSALIENRRSYVFRSYEKENDFRKIAIENLRRMFKHYPVNCVIEGDIQNYINNPSNLDVPTNIDYLFIDAEHTREMAEWYVKYLFNRVEVGGVIQIHDFAEKSGLEEINYLLELRKEGKLPLKPIYIASEYYDSGVSASWWEYMGQ
jgi:predicted O-methyltransferase YrrM